MTPKTQKSKISTRENRGHKNGYEHDQEKEAERAKPTHRWMRTGTWRRRTTSKWKSEALELNLRRPPIQAGPSAKSPPPSRSHLNASYYPTDVDIASMLLVPAEPSFAAEGGDAPVKVKNRDWRGERRRPTWGDKDQPGKTKTNLEKRRPTWKNEDDEAMTPLNEEQLPSPTYDSNNLTPGPESTLVPKSKIPNSCLIWLHEL
ncbi:hypothetical protein BDN72DRAFT_857651 [Pluteus cervinus]|uniref:Uncharacterized protein n=1 Tax=Pluteus cervinus TaxID=181527 RepID=A0ACD3AV76_9AGAR|nr:hypothetical protein BDN72DRAFT_857651 [Pluteus cervinus]